MCGHEVGAGRAGLTLVQKSQSAVEEVGRGFGRAFAFDNSGRFGRPHRTRSCRQCPENRQTAQNQCQTSASATLGALAMHEPIESCGHNPSRFGSVARVYGQTRRQDSGEWTRNRGRQRWRTPVNCRGLSGQRSIGAGAERMPAGEELDQKHAQREEVRLAAIDAVRVPTFHCEVQKFRCHISRGSAKRRRRFFTRRQVEVDHPGRTARFEDDIGRFQIAVDHVLFVEVIDGLGDAGSDGARPDQERVGGSNDGCRARIEGHVARVGVRCRKEHVGAAPGSRGGRDSIRQGAGPDERHAHGSTAIDLASPTDVDDIGVGKPADEPRLGGTAGCEFEGPQAANGRVVAQVSSTERTATEFGSDFETFEGGTHFGPSRRGGREQLGFRQQQAVRVQHVLNAGLKVGELFGELGGIGCGSALLEDQVFLVGEIDNYRPVQREFRMGRERIRRGDGSLPGAPGGLHRRGHIPGTRQPGLRSLLEDHFFPSQKR